MVSEETKKKMSLAQKGKRPKNFGVSFGLGLKGENHPGWKGGKPKCKDCGKNVKGAKAIRCKNCYSKFYSGSRNNKWKGGITPHNQRFRHSIEYKLWRKAVFERDNYRCIWCGAGNTNGERTTLNADHIKPFSLYPELRLAIDNGRTLCLECHKTTDTYGVKTSMKL